MYILFPSASQLCDVYYAPLNFRDLMLATGKLSVDALPGDLATQVGLMLLFNLTTKIIVALLVDLE